MKDRLFISYSVHDKAIAGAIRDLLKKIGISCFIAHEDIDVEDIWEPKIIRRVKNSKYILVIGTKGIERSAWVNFEVGLGYERHFTFLIDDLSKRVSYINSKQAIFVESDNLEKSLKRLLKQAGKRYCIAVSIKMINELIKQKEFRNAKKEIEEHIALRDSGLQKKALSMLARKPRRFGKELYRKNMNSEVYALDNLGFLHHIPVPECMFAMGYTWTDVLSLNDVTFGRFEIGLPLPYKKK